MTAKRDFKRRVRQRQARTGESYVTARRHVMAGRPAADEPPGDPDADQTLPGTTAATLPSGDVAAPAAEFTVRPERPEPPDAGGDGGGGGGDDDDDDDDDDDNDNDGDGAATGGISVVELVDVSDEAKRVGLVCRVLMFPELIQRIAPARVLGRLRELLVATVGDPATALLSELALTGRLAAPRKQPVQNLGALRLFVQRARAGLGGTLDDGATLAFHVADGDAMIAVMCTLSATDAIELSAIDDLVPERWRSLAPLIAARARSGPQLRPGSAVTSALLDSLSAERYLPLLQPPLFIVHGGRRHLVTGKQFVIGRGTRTSDLAIRAGKVSRKHAAVVHRDGAYYLKDLGSVNGIIYKGMRIDNKRIEEGDTFQIGDDEISFSFRDE